jgi:hypothetical protein
LLPGLVRDLDPAEKLTSGNDCGIALPCRIFVESPYHLPATHGKMGRV